MSIEIRTPNFVPEFFLFFWYAKIFQKKWCGLLLGLQNLWPQEIWKFWLKIHKRQNRSKNVKIDSKIVKIVVQIVILIKFIHFVFKKLLGFAVARQTALKDAYKLDSNFYNFILFFDLKLF